MAHRCYCNGRQSTAANVRCAAPHPDRLRLRAAPGFGAGQVDHRGRQPRELAAVDRRRAAAQDPAGTSSSVAGRAAGQVRARRDDGAGAGRRSRRPRRRAPEPECRSRPGRHSQSHGSAAPGSRGRACTGPGRSAAANARDAASSSGRHASSTSTLGERRSAVGWIAARPLSAYRSAAGVARGRADQAVDRVGRQHDELPGADRPDDSVDLAHGRRPSTTRSMPARSGVTRTSRSRARSSSAADAVACPAPTSSTSAPPGERRDSTARDGLDRALGAASAACGSQSRTSGSSPAGRRRRRTAGWRRRDPTGLPAGRRRGRGARARSRGPSARAFSARARAPRRSCRCR